MTNEDIAAAASRAGRGRLHIDVARWGATDRQPHPTHPLLLTLHSYGADEGEFDEAMGLIAPHNDYVALRAPIALPSQGYGWFPEMMPVGARLAADALAAAQAVDEWVMANVPDERPVVPIGFSQGAAVALHLLRVHPERYRAAVSLSGFHSSEDAPADERLAACDVAVFHGYGRNDKVVPRFELIATAAWLDEHTYLTTKSYPGLGHALNLSEITDLRNWLTAHDIITGVM